MGSPKSLTLHLVEVDVGGVRLSGGAIGIVLKDKGAAEEDSPIPSTTQGCFGIAGSSNCFDLRSPLLALASEDSTSSPEVDLTSPSLSPFEVAEGIDSAFSSRLSSSSSSRDDGSSGRGG